MKSRRRARERSDAEILVFLGQALEGVAGEDLLPRPHDLSSLELIERSSKDASRMAFEHAELDDVAGNAVRQSRCDLDDQIVGRGHDSAPHIEPSPVRR